MEISFLNNIKKYNSNSGKTSIKNVMNEAFRDAENYKNNVNQNLTELNKVLIRDLNVLKQQYEDTEVSKNAKDIISVVSNVQCGDFEGKYNADLTYFLKLDEWEKYYRENLKFLQQKLGENAHCVYAVIHYDESTPHLHSMWTFSQENKQEKIEVNYKKIQNALKTDFTRKNAKLGDKALKAGTAEYKEEFQKFCEENKQKKIEKQIKKLQNKKSEKRYKFETGTSPLNRAFFREVNGEFKNRMEYQKEMLKLQKRLEIFSSEKTEFVVTRSKKVNSSEDLDIRKRDLEDELENAEFNLSVTKTDSERSALRKYVALLTKSEIVEEKKTISKDEFLKRFEEYATEIKEINGNFIDRTFSKVKELVNVKKKLEEKKQDKNIKNKYKKVIIEELKNINETLENIDFDEIEKKIKKYEKSEKVEMAERRKEKIYDEIRNANEDLKEIRENIEEMYDRRNEIYYELSESEEKIESRKKEAEKTYVPSPTRIKELEKEAIEKAEKKAEIEIEKKNAELKEIKRNVEQQQQVQEMNKISIAEDKKRLDKIRKESEEIEKKVAEERSLSIKELAEKTLKNAPISRDEIDDYIEKNQDKFQDLIEKRQEKIENEIEKEMKQDMREDTKQAFSVFEEIVRQYAKKNVYKDVINFKEAKLLTIQAFSEIKATSENFFTDFVKNLRNKVQEFIAKRKNSEKASELNEKQSKKVR